MFGVGIFEILVILIVAVIALGPNKLPQAIIDIVKFFRAVKKTMAEAKDTFDKEIQLSEIKKEALKYKDTLTNEVNKLTKDMELDKLREISTDSVVKPLQDATKELEQSTQELNSTLQTLNTEIGYDKPSTTQVSATPDSKDIESTKSLEDSKVITPSEAQDSHHMPKQEKDS
ncbi:Twin-arginine translocation protein TatB [Helicobacter typhlonius]|uniref:Sec-independent protein translocase protein TatB homolog n=2 Tax=Helicobacter typhlonius TaxID=76936 RepID=A0A099UD49_9HELI|nr:Sec-independent protein translocase protein TatB [Helicobacter typhlonius]TLD79227.1 Sec-independent protein translocase subunit TatB [Helicobacter typhlonius]CUU40574.1 Twin-arginine translocation protein TatB [Helicobacter typhlonius]